MTIKSSYPLSAIVFILLCSFFERFAFYAIRTLLPLYLRNVLLTSSEYTSTVVYNISTFVYNIFIMSCYIAPLIGAIVSDAFIGNYRTIVFATAVFNVGGVLLSGIAYPPLNLPSKNVFVYLTLGLIVLGSGGVQPCISAFGGDQFAIPGQMLKVDMFFSIFTWVDNVANLVSTLVTVLGIDDSCFHLASSCFSLIFLMESGLIALSLVFMMCGKRFFYLKKREGNILVQVSKCVTHALGKRIKNGKNDCHWLDYSIPVHGQQLVADIKKVLNLLVLYLPLPVFWALYVEQTSRWALQANGMFTYNHMYDGYYGYIITPVISRLLILLFIPLFEKVIYPVFGRYNKLKNPLHRILVGGILAAFSFVVSGFVTATSEHARSTEDQIQVLLQQLPQYILITAAEAMLQITGMQFSYSQAPSSMKSFMQAIWLLSSAIGHVIATVISHISIFDTQSQESFLFAGIMFFDMLIFGLIARRYKFTESTDLNQNCDPVLETDNNEKSAYIENSAFEDSL